jgi:hypothetical protein
MSHFLSHRWKYTALVALLALLFGAAVLVTLFEGDPPPRADRFLALYKAELGSKLNTCNEFPEHTSGSFLPDVAIFEVAGFDESAADTVDFEGFQPFGISVLEDRQLQNRVTSLLAEEPDDAHTIVFYSVETKTVGSYVFADTGKPTGAKALQATIELCIVDRASWRGVRNRIVLEPDKIVTSMLQHAGDDKTGGYPEAAMLTRVDSLIDGRRFLGQKDQAQSPGGRLHP